MANEMRDAIKGNDHSDIRKIAIAGDAALAAAILANTEPASTVTVADSANRYTGTNVEACLAEIAGASRTTETVKATYDAHKATDMYPVIAQGFDTTGAAGNTAIDTKPSNRTPAITDTVVMITGVVTATGIAVAVPAIVTADTAQGVMVNPVSDTGIKIRWGKAGGGVNYALNTYTIWLKPA